jgi:hypothetical protein
LRVEYRVLGPLEVLVDGRPTKLAGPRQRAVLACLLAAANKTVPASRLVDELWAGDPPVTATNVLQSYVSQLRKALGKDAIETRGPGYAVRVGREELISCAYVRSRPRRSPPLWGLREYRASKRRDAAVVTQSQPEAHEPGSSGTSQRAGGAVLGRTL